MSLFAGLLIYFIVKALCKELTIADYKWQDKKLREIECKYTGGKYKGYMMASKPGWNEYCDEVNPMRVKFGREPYKKNEK